MPLQLCVAKAVMVHGKHRRWYALGRFVYGRFYLFLELNSCSDIGEEVATFMVVAFALLWTIKDGGVP